MGEINSDALDKHITGNYGEDQFSEVDEWCVCGHHFEDHSATPEYLDAPCEIEGCDCKEFEIKNGN